MRYNSIGEYFYRLSNRCLALALFPVIIVWVAYAINWYFFSGLQWIDLRHEMIWPVVSGTGLFIVIIFWLQDYFAKGRTRRLIGEPGLGVRIKQYIPIVLIRFRSFSFMILLIGLGVFITTNLHFFYLLPIPVFSFLIYWPGRWRIAKDMKLKPGEKEILKNKTLGV